MLTSRRINVASIAIAFESDSPQLRWAAQGLSEHLKLPLVVAGSSGFDAFLVVTDSRLELRAAGRGGIGPVYVDFLAGRMRQRQRELASTRQLIARAVGFKGKPLAVIDATAGLGRDAFVLACLGCNVTAIERSPIVAALLADGLKRADADPHVGPIVRERLRLIEGDSRELLSKMSPADRPDVIYIDPMFPHRAKSALAKKEMRLCRLVAGDDPDADELLRVALAAAQGRVVVKRWLRAPALVRPPAFAYKGRAIRYDVYPCPLIPVL